MRKILISEGFGGNWATYPMCSDYSNPDTKKQLFCLTYQPLIDLIAQEPDWYTDKDTRECMREQFIRDYNKAFGCNSTYCGDMVSLKVHEVPDGARVRLFEYDGAESFEIEGEFDGWL